MLFEIHIIGSHLAVIWILLTMTSGFPLDDATLKRVKRQDPPPNNPTTGTDPAQAPSQPATGGDPPVNGAPATPPEQNPTTTQPPSGDPGTGNSGNGGAPSTGTGGAPDGGGGSPGGGGGGAPGGGGAAPGGGGGGAPGGGGGGTPGGGGGGAPGGGGGAPGGGGGGGAPGGGGGGGAPVGGGGGAPPAGSGGGGSGTKKKWTTGWPYEKYLKKCTMPRPQQGKWKTEPKDRGKKKKCNRAINNREERKAALESVAADSKKTNAGK